MVSDINSSQGIRDTARISDGYFSGKSGRSTLAGGLLIALLSVAMPASDAQAESPGAAIEIDQYGNINQRTFGVFQSKKILVGDEEQGQFSQRTVNRQQALSPFSRLELHVPAHLVYNESGPVQLQIKGSTSALQALKVEVRAGTLVIESKGSFHGPLHLDLTGRRLSGVEIYSAANAVFNDLAVNQFQLKVRGAAEVAIKGRASNCMIDSQGVGDIDQSGFDCDVVSIQASGSSDIRVRANTRLDGVAQGAGDILVFGQPPQRSLKVSGVIDVAYRQ